MVGYTDHHPSHQALKDEVLDWSLRERTQCPQRFVSLMVYQGYLYGYWGTDLFHHDKRGNGADLLLMSQVKEWNPENDKYSDLEQYFAQDGHTYIKYKGKGEGVKSYPHSPHCPCNLIKEPLITDGLR